MREIAEFVAAWTLLKGLGLLPRRAALAAGRWIGLIAYSIAGGLKRTGRRNLSLAFPEKSEEERERILRNSFAGLGRGLGEFSQLPKLRKSDDAHRTMKFVNREIVMDAIAEGKGVLFLTGHLGAWELTPFCMRLSGSPPVNFLVRRIDNPRVERLAETYRTLCGNRSIDKKHAARATLAALAAGEMVGILMDLNTLDHEGVFVDYFGVPASTTTGLATFAMRTEAVVIPGFASWNEDEQRYVLYFGERIEIAKTGSKEDDVRVNTQRFTKVVESFVREHPDEWLWIHRRWKTRPPGEPAIY